MNDYDRRCIDGSIHGCSVCLGLCQYHGHPGYLTEKLMKEHQCLEKGCHYFLSKPSRERVSKGADESKEITKIAQAAVSEMEGLKVMRVEADEAGGWTVYYIAIAEYVLRGIEETLSMRTGKAVRFSQLPYRFDYAAKIILDQ